MYGSMWYLFNRIVKIYVMAPHRGRAESASLADYGPRFAEEKTETDEFLTCAFPWPLCSVTAICNPLSHSLCGHISSHFMDMT